VSIIATVVFDNLPALSKQATELAHLAVYKAAFDIEGQAKAVVPVDTGFLKNSISVEPAGDLTAYVGPHAEYSVHVEYGTSRSRAQPYMRPAAERVRPAFIEAMKQIAKM